MPSEIANVSEELINELRTRFLSEAAKESELYAEADVECVRREERHIKRYLYSRKCNVEDALKLMKAALKFRKEYDISQLTEHSFPLEFFQIAGIQTYGKDLNGGSVIILRIKLNKKMNEWAPFIKKYFVYLLENEDLKFESNQINGVSLLFDGTDAGVSNIDIDLLTFIVTTMRDYYPVLVNAVIIKDLPWVLNWVFKLVQTWLPEEHKKKLHLITKKEVTNYVAVEQLPQFMDGTNQSPYRVVPKDVMSIHEFAQKFDVPKKAVEQFVKHFQPYIAGEKV